MHPARYPIRISPAQRRRLTLALATAEERLVEAHAQAAEAFLRVTDEALAYERGLEIFHRLVGVPERIQAAVAVQALTRLARRPAAPEPGFEAGAGWRGALRQMARRLRGRRADALRLRIDRAGERAREMVQGAYLEGAALVIRELKGEVEPAEAVQLYLEALEVEPGWGERIFHRAVAAVGDGARDEPRESGGVVA